MRIPISDQYGDRLIVSEIWWVPGRNRL